MDKLYEQTKKAHSFFIDEKLEFWEKIDKALSCLAGLDLTAFPGKTRVWFEAELVEINKVFSRYDIKTAHNYEQISDHDPDRRVIVLDGDGSLLMQLGSLAVIGGAAPRNLVHMVFNNGIYQTSGCQEMPCPSLDFVMMAREAGYRNGCAFSDLLEFTQRLPGLLSEDGPLLVELHTGLAECTPMTAGLGPPFHKQVADLRARLSCDS
jgi:hypothetical protein